MRRMKKLFLMALVGLALPASASAGDTPCVGTLIGAFDTVVVPPGALCILINSTVRGNVKALENSRLVMVNDTVRGNVDGDKANAVQVIDSTINGNIQIKEAGDPVITSAVVVNSVLTDGNIQIEKGNTAGLGDWVVESNIVQKGNIKVEENNSRFASDVVDNQVAQDIQVFKNTGSGQKFVVLNTVRELQCKENAAPFIGGPNTAQKAEGQCF